MSCSPGADHKGGRGVSPGASLDMQRPCTGMVLGPPLVLMAKPVWLHQRGIDGNPAEKLSLKDGGVLVSLVVWLWKLISYWCSCQL